MPLVESGDYGTTDGKLHSHRFPGANTALPFANEDDKQMESVLNFLKNDVISVDIFAVSPESGAAKTAASIPGELSTTFAVGEEAESSSRVVGTDTGTPEPFGVTAPLNKVLPALRRGDTERVDVVVRTRKVGHFFPAGTVDGFDVWLELKATDDQGQVLFWSGRVDDDGRGPVEKGAHFYRCDFQVHTPRDRNWNGANRVTDDERNDYARRLVQACRERGVCGREHRRLAHAIRQPPGGE